MAIIKRCVICDEKLVRNRCPFCGLDHTNRMKMNYRLNTSRPYQRTTRQSSAAQAANNVHGSRNKAATSVPNQKRIDKPIPNVSVNRTEYSARTAKPIRQPQAKSKKAQQSEHTWTRFLPILGVLLVMLVNFFADEYGGSYEREPEYIVHETGIHEESYEDVWYDLEVDGETFDIVLSQGEYLVGTHLPEGYYHVELVKGSSILSITNSYQGIYDYYHFSPSNGGVVQLDDLPLYQDTHLKVMEGAYLALSTDSGQMDMMYETSPNPLSVEEVVLEEGISYVVGTDFPAGVYDLHQAEGGCYMIAGRFDVTESASVDQIYSDIWLDIDGSQNVYRNLVLEEGMAVYLDQNMEGTTILLPSEFVKSDGYDTYYELYW